MQMPWEISERAFAKRDLSNGRGAGRLHRYVGKNCPYCDCIMHRGYRYTGRQAPSRDHLVPLSRGGLNVAANIVVCCRQCNERKGALDAEEYAAWRAGNVSRLDHGWWEGIRRLRPDLPRYSYSHYSQLWRRMASVQRNSVNDHPLVAAVLTAFPGARVVGIRR